ncbi:hypothetical protein JCM1840_007167 [Sporobolomyces johnsonii]
MLQQQWEYFDEVKQHMGILESGLRSMKKALEETVPKLDPDAKNQVHRLTTIAFFSSKNTEYARRRHLILDKALKLCRANSDLLRPTRYDWFSGVGLAELSAVISQKVNTLRCDTIAKLHLSLGHANDGTACTPLSLRALAARILGTEVRVTKPKLERITLLRSYAENLPCRQPDTNDKGQFKWENIKICQMSDVLNADLEKYGGSAEYEDAPSDASEDEGNEEL